MTRRRARLKTLVRGAALGLVLGACAVGTALPAGASGLLASVSMRTGQTLTHQINDDNGRLAEGETELRSALAALDTATGVRLYVLSVDSTGGRSSADYADQRATSAGLGTDEPLLVLVSGKGGDYYLSVAQDFRLDDAAIRQVTDAVEGPFAAGDYAGAATAAAGSLQGELSSGPTSGSSSGLGSVATVAGLGALALVGGSLALNRRRKRPDGSRAEAGGQSRGSRPPVPLEQLHADVARRLVSTDEDVRGADRELAFAQAEFGDRAVARFATALQEAKTAVTGAFSLRQQLQEEIPEDEPTARRLLAEILDRCERAAVILQAQAHEFATLRDLAGRADTLIPVLAQRSEAAETTVPQARATVDELAARFSPAAVQAVAQAPARAADLLQTALAALTGVGARRGADLATTATAGGGQDAPPRLQAQQGIGAKALAVRAAEQAIGQAEELLASVTRVQEQTLQAVQLLPQAMSELQRDLGALDTIPATDALTRATQGARTALARAQSTTGTDPLGALTHVTEADAALDRAVAGAREEGARRDHARAVLDHVLLTAQAGLDQANDLIGAHRDRVGGQARTFASEASQLLAQARGLGDGEPVQALDMANRAAQRAQAAVSAAQQDVARSGRGGYGGGSWGSGSSWGNGNVIIGGGLGSIFGDGWSTGGSWGGGGGGRRGGGGGGGGRRGGGGGGRRGAGRR